MNRAGLLRGGAGAVAVAAAGGALAGAGAADGLDARILAVFAQLEALQERFYREAVRSGRLRGELLAFATAARDQEARHVAMLATHLRHAPKAPRADFGDALSSPQRFGEAAVALEEAAIATYVGQTANLSRALVAPVGTMTSVEARQAAWIRSLTGADPAPHAADPARRPEAVFADLRRRGLIA